MEDRHDVQRVSSRQMRKNLDLIDSMIFQDYERTFVGHYGTVHTYGWVRPVLCLLAYRTGTTLRTLAYCTYVRLGES